MKFEMIVRRGTKELAKVETPMELPKGSISVADLEKVIETEQFLERIFQMRFYINWKGGDAIYDRKKQEVKDKV